VLVRYPSGVVVPALGISLSAREFSDTHAWFVFVTRGLYSFEFKIALPSNHGVHLIRPTDDHFVVFDELLRRDPNYQMRTLAAGEFRYLFASNRREGISLWLYEFKSISMFALTLPPSCPDDLKSRIAAIEWPAPPGRNA